MGRYSDMMAILKYLKNLKRKGSKSFTPLPHPVPLEGRAEISMWKWQEATFHTNIDQNFLINRTDQ